MLKFIKGIVVTLLLFALVNFLYWNLHSNALGYAVAFQFNIPPGDYVINAKNDGISKTCSPVSVSIGADEMRSVNISCDTGIR